MPPVSRIPVPIGALTARLLTPGATPRPASGGAPSARPSLDGLPPARNSIGANRARVQGDANNAIKSAVNDLSNLMKKSVAANSSMLGSQMAAQQANAQNGMAAQQATAAQNQAESLNEAAIKLTNKSTDGVKSAIS